MVTSPSSQSKTKITADILKEIGFVAGKLLWNGYALTDLSEANVRVSKGKISFARYSSLSELSPTDILMCSRLIPIVDHQLVVSENDIFHFFIGKRNGQLKTKLTR